MSIRLRTTAGLAIGTAISILSLAAQQTAPPTQGAPPGGVGSTTTPGGRPGIGQPTPGRERPFPESDPNQNRFPEMQRPIYLSGKVVLDDGTPPPDSVVIERVCNGQPRAEAYTDSKGRFSFQLGQNQGVMQDASIGSGADGGFGETPGVPGQRRNSGMSGMGGRGGLSERDLMGCELRAVLAGFRSESVNLAGRRAFDNPDLGTIVLRRLANVEGTTISAVALQAPKDAKKAYEKGRDLVKKKKVAEAQKEYEKAVQVYPKYSYAWFELGRVHESQNNMEEARKAYAEALAADPKYVSPYRQLANIAFKEQKWQEVADTTDRVLKLDPVDYPDQYFYNSVANYYLKKYDAAERSAREAQKLDPGKRMPKVNHLLGAILIEKQDYTGAAEQIRGYLKMLPADKQDEMAQKQLVELEKALAAK